MAYFLNLRIPFGQVPKTSRVGGFVDSPEDYVAIEAMLMGSTGQSQTRVQLTIMLRIS